jgi:DNA-binding beta-propeller fold protein YncE
MAALGVRQLLAVGRVEPPMRAQLAFVGAIGSEQGVSVFAMEETRWKPLHFVPTEAPGSLALHPSGESLYVLNEVSEYRGLPRGTVEAYRIDRKTGKLTLLIRQPLALSAIMPRHLAVSPDGKTLAVAVHGGGAYNILPIMNDGSVGRLQSTLKETGSGPIVEHQQTAHPQAVVFDRTGTRLIAADFGCDRLSVFSFSKTTSALAAHTRLQLASGSGPRHVAPHPDGDFLYIDHALDGSLSGFRYDAVTGIIGKQCISIRGAFGDALALHPGGEIVYSARNSELSSWQIKRANEALDPSQTIALETEAVHAISPLQDGSAIIALTDLGSIRIAIDAATGRLGGVVSMAGISGARSITML